MYHRGRIIAVAALLLLNTITMTSCDKQKRSRLRGTHEQIERLAADKSQPLAADTSQLISIDADGLFEGKGFDLADIVRDIRLVPLETTPESRIGKARRVILTSSHIVISDESFVRVFSTAGKYVGRIALGPNPMETDFTLDRPNNEILVFAQGSIGHYDMECKRLSAETIPLQFSAFATTPTSNTMAIWLDGTDENPSIGDLGEETSYLVMNREGALPAYIPTKQKADAPPREGMALPYSDEGIVIGRSFCDTIFTLTDTGVKARYALNYKRHSLPEWINVKEIKGAQGDESRYFFAGNAQITLSGVFFKIQNIRAMTVYAFYDKRTGSLAGGLPILDYRVLPPIFNPVATLGDYYAALFNTYQTDDGQGYHFLGHAIPEQEKLKIVNVRHDDNPVIALYRVQID